LVGVPRDFDELRPGVVLGPYELLLPVGAGGMARVWAARVRSNGQIVALKMLLPELAENPSFQQMFLDEARIASHVRHPNVCGTYELVDLDGIMSLTMEWVDGPSLMRIVRPHPADDDAPRIPIHPRLAARIVADTCAGLHAAHESVGDDGMPLGVVHRDVSPHNVLLTSAGHVKVTDFGVAKALGKSHMTVTGQIKGKLAYMSPEQLTGAGVDRRSDVFALGCVLYEISVGMKPFQGEHDPQVMASIMLGRYDLPSAVMQGFPPDLEEVIMRALANDPDQRYATAQHMQQALESYLRASGPPVTANQVSALIRERCGEEVEARLRALHPGDGALGAVPRSRLGATESGSGGAMEIDRRPASERRAFVWVAVAALVGASLGFAVLSYVRTLRKSRSAARAIPTQHVTVAASSAPAPIQVDSVRSAATAAPRRRVRLRVEPQAAALVVDGVTLPRGTDTVDRPTDGGTVTVLVRADKHDDTIVLVDQATPDELDIKLVPEAVVPAVKRAVAAPEGGSQQPKAVKDAGSSAAETPPNPYE
jgi:serine/threonine protein kinase